MPRSPAPSSLALALALLAAAPAWAQSGGVAGALSGAPAAGQALTVDDVFRSAGAPRVLVAAHRASTGRWGARILDMLFNRRRGDPARAENSLAAIDAAVAAGAHVAEVDVRHTKDGALVLMHDEAARPTARGRSAT